MQIDKITFNDLAVFHAEEEFSLFHKLNFTKTFGGKEWLRRFFTEPHADLNRITGTQNIIKALLAHINDWPPEITNGTIIMMDKFLDYNLDPVPEHPNAISALSYRLLHGQDYSMIKYSVRHFADFLRGLKKLSELFDGVALPANLKFYIDRLTDALREEPLRQLADAPAEGDYSLEKKPALCLSLAGNL